jgi:hypothetical protein
MRKCNDEIYQLAKDQALVKKFDSLFNKLHDKYWFAYWRMIKKNR